jgi:hypothetical protein
MKGWRTLLVAPLLACACAPSHVDPTSGAGPAAGDVPLPARVVSGEAWRSSPPAGHPADATRRNLRPGESLTFGELEVTVAAVHEPAAGSGDARAGELRLRRGAHGAGETRLVGAGRAITWEGYRVAVVAIPAPGELGGGLVALEVAVTSSLPAHLVGSTVAGGAEMRLRVPHRITRVTLHHTGSAEPLRPGDDPVAQLRGLQSWGARDRNWWDVPYHYLIDLDGRVYEGRDWRYMGETNTGYNPSGHFLISVMGNYQLQEPTAAQLDAVVDMMAWALRRFGLSPDVIGGHYDFADTTCPGQHLKALLEDGTLQRLVAQKLAQ